MECLLHGGSPSDGLSTSIRKESSAPSTRRSKRVITARTSPPSSPSSVFQRSELAGRRHSGSSINSLGSGPLLLLQSGPAVFQLTQDLPEEPAVHSTGHATAGAGRERKRFGVFQVMGHLVKKRVEQLLERPDALPAFPCIDANQPSRLVI